MRSMLTMATEPAVCWNFKATSWYSRDVEDSVTVCTVTSFPAWLTGIGSQVVGSDVADNDKEETGTLNRFLSKRFKHCGHI